jgi:hypothetical protein
MTFVKGQVANPAGRPKGSKNKRHDDLFATIQKVIETEYGIKDYDPVVSMAMIANDPNNPIDLRANCHDKVAKYVRPVLKAVEVTGNVDVSVDQKYDATDKLLAALEAMASAKKSGSPMVLDHAPAVHISDMKRNEGPEAPVLVVLDAVTDAVLAEAEDGDGHEGDDSTDGG